MVKEQAKIPRVKRMAGYAPHVVTTRGGSNVEAEFQSAYDLRQYLDNKRAVPELLSIIGELLQSDGPMRCIIEDRVKILNVGCVPGRSFYMRDKSLEDSVKSITPSDPSQMFDFYFHLQRIVEESRKEGFNLAVKRIHAMQWDDKQTEDDE